ncbi:hypothetical protein ACA910_006203 [Epithemia clementina (nom. ined.)]
MSRRRHYGGGSRSNCDGSLSHLQRQEQQDQQQQAVVPQPNDVLLGRGGMVTGWNGNKLFQREIERNTIRYRDTPTRAGRMNIVLEIIETVQTWGRFLDRSPSSHEAVVEDGVVVVVAAAAGNDKGGGSGDASATGSSSSSTTAANVLWYPADFNKIRKKVGQALRYQMEVLIFDAPSSAASTTAQPTASSALSSVSSSVFARASSSSLAFLADMNSTVEKDTTMMDGASTSASSRQQHPRRHPNASDESTIPASSRGIVKSFASLNPPSRKTNDDDGLMGASSAVPGGTASAPGPPTGASLAFTTPTSTGGDRHSKPPVVEYRVVEGRATGEHAGSKSEMGLFDEGIMAGSQKVNRISDDMIMDQQKNNHKLSLIPNKEMRHMYPRADSGTTSTKSKTFGIPKDDSPSSSSSPSGGSISIDFSVTAMEIDDERHGIASIQHPILSDQEILASLGIDYASFPQLQQQHQQGDAANDNSQLPQNRSVAAPAGAGILEDDDMMTASTSSNGLDEMACIIQANELAAVAAETELDQRRQEPVVLQMQEVERQSQEERRKHLHQQMVGLVLPPLRSQPPPAPAPRKPRSGEVVLSDRDILAALGYSEEALSQILSTQRQTSDQRPHQEGSRDTADPQTAERKKEWRSAT